MVKVSSLSSMTSKTSSLLFFYMMYLNLLFNASIMEKITLPIFGNPSISKNFIAESNLAHMAEHWQEGYYSATVT